jgi:hypothetical protein
LSGQCSIWIRIRISTTSYRPEASPREATRGRGRKRLVSSPPRKSSQRPFAASFATA